jgi:hypothetical protein
MLHVFLCIFVARPVDKEERALSEKLLLTDGYNLGFAWKIYQV